MKILHLSPYFPSTAANHAGGVCMGKQVETLQKYNQVYVLTFEASEFDRTLREKYQNDSHYYSVKITRSGRVLHMLLEPWLPNYFAARSSLRFACKLIWMVKKYQIDAIHAEYASMGQYLWIKRLFPRLVFHMTEHDMTAQSYERKLGASHGIKKWYLRYQLNRVKAAERFYCTHADRLFTFNEKDRRLIEDAYGRKDCLVLNPYYGLDDAMLEKPVSDGQRQYANLCFLGQMGRDENYLAAMRLIRIAKAVKEEIPELQVYIVGNKPPETLKEQENEWIHVTGFVEDVDSYLKQAQLAVFPLTLGAGIKLKVLRSLAAGTPVITGIVGAEGIDEAGEVIIPAETDEEYREQILNWMKRQDELSRRSEESQAFVRKHFSWKHSEEVLRSVYGETKN